MVRHVPDAAVCDVRGVVEAALLTALGESAFASSPFIRGYFTNGKA